MPNFKPCGARRVVGGTLMTCIDAPHPHAPHQHHFAGDALPALESAIEQYFVSKCRAAGAMVFKLPPMTRAGLPDRIVLFAGKTLFVELKRDPAEELREVQKATFERMEKQTGNRVYVLSSKEQVDIWIAWMVENSTRKKNQLAAPDFGR